MFHIPRSVFRYSRLVLSQSRSTLGYRQYSTTAADKPKVKVLVLYYSVYGHVHQMAKAVAEGALGIEGAHVDVKRVPETLSKELLDKIGAKDFSSIHPEVAVDDLPNYDAIILGTPTRFGNMCAQMKSFLDGCGSLFASNALMGKVGAVFTSTNTQHGGQESTILSTHIPLYHLGFVVVGLPYTYKGFYEKPDEIQGNSPYGASTIAGPDGSRQPSEIELEGARYMGRHVTDIAKRLAMSKPEKME